MLSFDDKGKISGHTAAIKDAKQLNRCMANLAKKAAAAQPAAGDAMEGEATKEEL
jgi:hypothetical protein